MDLMTWISPEMLDRSLGFSGAGPTSAFLFEMSFAAEEIADSSVTENHEVWI